MTRLVFTDEFPYEYHNYLDKLEDKERKVVVSYFGLSGKPKLTLLEIAEVFRTPGVDTNNIRNMLSLAMGKLRDANDQASLKKFHERAATNGADR